MAQTAIFASNNFNKQYCYLNIGSADYTATECLHLLLNELSLPIEYHNMQLS